ncbi:MAG: 16S rRNA (cytidine(1402)-2'-O)-methyltransferase [Clostridia bacterium]|nr:16S rRNA (cytidine(1402)-2'-O)-methyltransferase [Clostridia bacterium]MCI1999955.1 16S rRNA (cytidine(1402)-2'-O)-methyltransferase [Clostridia bacterium]MCI2014511.1 16S rRNA (cytidine(1402)-2'-O)-methyltransferase [Clostridia bacterium]
MSGTLYLCGTPIGNLGDITLREIETLKNCDLIAAEDTRNTLKLLNHFNISTPMTSYHEHNKYSKGPVLIEKLKSGTNIALVTDAGMPGISDPGCDLAKDCINEGIPVTSAPGPTAVITALVISGMDSRRFVFEGFLPSDKKECAYVLKNIENETRTVVFYEAPHRLCATLKTLIKATNDRKAACVREITKKYEEVKRGRLSELLEFYKLNEPKGEFVIIIAGKSIEEIKNEEIKSWESISIEEHVKKYINDGFSEKDAMKLAAKDRGITKREIYAKLKKD